MTDLHALIDALDEIYERRDYSYVTITVEGSEGLYAEFWANRNETGLKAEVVGNDELGPAEQLTPDQQRAMRDLGWEGDGEAMWARTWPSTPTRADRQRAAYETLRALGEVYEAAGAVRVAEVGLGGAEPRGGVGEGEALEAEPAATSKRQVMVLVLAAVLALLGVVLAAVFAA